MNRIKKIEKCKKCEGKGAYWDEGGHSSVTFEYDDPEYWGCYSCGGEGRGNFVKKGSGQVEITYEKVTCTECNGVGSTRYFKKGYGAKHTLFGNVSYEEQKAWEEKFTFLGKCERCKGSGEELVYESSKPAPKKEGCFITTACSTYYKLEDNCYELEVLRWFRDTYVCNIYNGREYLTEYYKESPKIVSFLQSVPDESEVYQFIYKCIKKSIKHIEDKEYENAFEEYKNMYQSLLRRMNTEKEKRKGFLYSYYRSDTVYADNISYMWHVDV